MVRLHGDFPARNRMAAARRQAQCTCHEHTLQQGRNIYTGDGRGAGGTLMWAALLRRLARTGECYDC